MKQYKLIGVTEYAKKHLSVEDLESLNLMIGCTIEESEDRAIIDNGILFIMPDLQETHIDFLQVEEIPSIS